MAKHPTPGQVKTRLATAIGPAAAARLYQAFVVDLAARLGGFEYAVTWAHWPPEAPFATLLPGARCIPQRGEDLGSRLEAAFEDLFAEGDGPVLALGVDAPHVGRAALDDGAAALTAGADLVLGPALDGGYFLVGLRAPAAPLFREIAWGTSTVLADTLERARALAMRTHLLAPTFDVDELADLIRLRALVAKGEVDLPATARVLTALALSS
jgi:hypothetical protein